MFITYFLWGLTQSFQTYDPFSKCLYVHIEKVSQSSSIVYKSSTWIVLCVGLSFVKRRDRGYFITMNDSSIFGDIKTNFSKQLFAIYSMFGNGSCVFQNNLNAVASGGQWPVPWTHRGPCSPHHHFHPCIYNNGNNIRNGDNTKDWSQTISHIFFKFANTHMCSRRECWKEYKTHRLPTSWRCILWSISMRFSMKTNVHFVKGTI